LRRAEQGAAKRRTWTVLRYGAKSWKTRRRLVARIEATNLGLDVRYVVTSLRGNAKHLYQTIYCGRGQAENFIKLHKAQLASDRTSCRDPRANQMRLILHTAAYWLLHTLRAAAPKRSPWRTAEFTTLRLRLIKPFPAEFMEEYKIGPAFGNVKNRMLRWPSRSEDMGDGARNRPLVSRGPPVPRSPMQWPATA
jgi:hypothetical protein